MSILTPQARPRVPVPGLQSANDDYGTSSPPVQTPKHDARHIKPLSDQKNATLPLFFTSAAEEARAIALKFNAPDVHKQAYAPVQLDIDNASSYPTLDSNGWHQPRPRSAGPPATVSVPEGPMSAQFAARNQFVNLAPSTGGPLANANSAMYHQVPQASLQHLYAPPDNRFTPSPTPSFAQLPGHYPMSSSSDSLGIYHSISRGNSPIDPALQAMSVPPQFMPMHAPVSMPSGAPMRQPSPLPLGMQAAHEWQTTGALKASYAASEAASDAADSSQGSEYVPDHGAGSSPPSAPKPPAPVSVPAKRKKAPRDYSDPDFSVVVQASTSRPVARDRSAKPPYSYAALIGQAILSTPSHKLSLNDVYLFIMHNYPFYRKQDAGWQNSIRHNLSLNQCFVKTARDQDNPGKGSLWTIVEGCEHQFEGGGFVKKGGSTKKRSQPSKPLNLSLPPPSFESDMSQIKPDNPRKRIKRSPSTTSIQSPLTPLPEDLPVPPPAVASRFPQPQPEVKQPPRMEELAVEKTLRPRAASVHYFDSPPEADIELAVAAEIEPSEPKKPRGRKLPPVASPDTMIFASPKLEHRFDGPVDITAELLSSPIAKSTDPEMHSLAGAGFLPPVQLHSPRARGLFQFDPSLAANFSGLLRSPTSSMRQGHHGMPGSPLRHLRSGSSPPSLTSRRMRYDTDSDQEDDAQSSIAGEEIQRPLSAHPELETPSRAMRSPFHSSGPFETTGSSRALQSLQDGHGTPSRRGFTGFSTPGRTILASPGPLFGDAYSDPYDYGGMLQSELDGFGDNLNESPRFNASRTFLPTTPKFSTPRFHSSSLYSPW